MRTSTACRVVAVLTGSVLLFGCLGCGTGPLEQTYAMQSGAEPVNLAIGERTELPELMEQMRTAMFYLGERLSNGTPEQIVRAAVQVSFIADRMSRLQPAIAKGGLEEAATFKRLLHDVGDMAIEVGKSVQNGQTDLADQYYARLYLTYNQWLRLYGRPREELPPMEIPEIEKPKPPETKSEPGGEPAPAPPGP